jgi:hypothetical protein
MIALSNDLRTYTFLNHNMQLMHSLVLGIKFSSNTFEMNMSLSNDTTFCWIRYITSNRTCFKLWSWKGEQLPAECWIYLRKYQETVTWSHVYKSCKPKVHIEHVLSTDAGFNKTKEK